MSTPTPENQAAPGTGAGTLAPELLEQASRWLAHDPDQESREQLRSLLDAAASGDEAAAGEVQSCFGAPLEFGTAGLRAAIAPGPSRMNVAVVRQTAAGLGRFLSTASAEQGFTEPAHIVIGFDARHRSADFARESAMVLVAAGLRVSLFSSALPTPVLAFAMKEMGADAGIMVTASHNPPADNGYKVYLGGRVVTGAGQGAQIVPPFDAQIADAIDHAQLADRIPTSVSGWEAVSDDVLDRYIAATLAALGPAANAELSIVTTAMHGVGGAPLLALLNKAGYSRVTPVAEQQEPDPDFPTVSFPNPEEPGAIDLALKTAEREGADLVIANDPDADRCAAAVSDPSLGAWRMLKGDELGAILGFFALQAVTELPEAERSQAMVANSVVSSRLLGAMAAAEGISHKETLTGFKWIAREEGLAFGYEEAIGYLTTPGLVRDKDGLSAALALAHIAGRLKASGRTLLDVLDALALEHGLYLTTQISVRLGHISQVLPLMAQLRQQPPASLGGAAVSEVIDLTQGTELLPPTDGLMYFLQDRSRVIVRPSGTEPKLKAYLEVIEEVGQDRDVAAARRRADSRLERIREELSSALGL